jgi:hypothetical protein
MTHPRGKPSRRTSQTLTEKAALDQNDDCSASAEEQSAYLRAKIAKILGVLALAVDGRPVKPQFLCAGRPSLPRRGRPACAGESE